MRTSVILARLNSRLVWMPAWLAVSEMPPRPSAWSVIAIRLAETCSPVESSESSSRSCGSGERARARLRSSSVLSPIAETTTTTRWPSSSAVQIRPAALRIRSALASEEPPYFWTRIGPGGPSLCCIASALENFGAASPNRDLADRAAEAMYRGATLQGGSDLGGSLSRQGQDG